MSKDYLIIVICLLALLGCLYTMLTVIEYRDAINEEWLAQWEASGCRVNALPSHLEYRMDMDYIQGGNRSENQD